ncbi:MAG: hypothetical protein V3S47_02360 [Acidobacteriota bacterium]
MTPAGSDATLSGPAAGDPSWRLRHGSGGGFSIDGPDHAEARPEATGFSIHGDRFERGVRLLPDGTGRGIVLTDAAGNDRDSVSTLTGGTVAADPPSVTLSDGRVFRVVCAGAGYALQGWDHPGTYLEVEPDGSEWRVRVTPAGSRMDGLERLVLLIAAVVVLDNGSPGMEGMNP